MFYHILSTTFLLKSPIWLVQVGIDPTVFGAPGAVRFFRFQAGRSLEGPWSTREGHIRLVREFGITRWYFFKKSHRKYDDL